MSETIKIKVYARTDYVGSECHDIVEFDKEEWESMSSEEQEEEMKDYAMNFIEWGYYEAK